MLSVLLTIFLILVIGVVWLLATIFFIFQLKYSTSSLTIVFMPTVSKTVRQKIAAVIDKYILERSQRTSDYYFLEPGCGLANVSYWIGKKYDFKKVVGIELDWLTWQGARIYNWLRGGSTELNRQNIFEYEWSSQPAVVYSFLSSDILTEMYTRGLLDNKLVISTLFYIKDVEPTEEISIPKNFYRSVYIYDLRH